MAEGLLEYEIRRLPDVVAAAVDDAAVTVLVQPTADADAVQAVVGAMLATASLERTVTVLGGMSTVDVRSRRFAPLVTGGIAGAGLLVSAAAAAALTGGLPILPAVDQPAEPKPIAPAVAAPAPVPAPSGGPTRLIVPGGKPDWASSQPPIALPPVAEAPVVELALAEAAPPPKPSRPAISKLALVAPPAVVPTSVAPAPPPFAAVVPDPEPQPEPDTELEVAEQDDDRHRHTRGEGHDDHGNGRGRGHEDGGKP